MPVPVKPKQSLHNGLDPSPQQAVDSLDSRLGQRIRAFVPHSRDPPIMTHTLHA